MNHSRSGQTPEANHSCPNHLCCLCSRMPLLSSHPMWSFEATAWSGHEAICRMLRAMKQPSASQSESGAGCPQSGKGASWQPRLVMQCMGWCQSACQKGTALVKCCADALPVLPVQFRAISMELWKTQDYHGSVRRKTVRYMRWVACPAHMCSAAAQAWRSIVLLDRRTGAHRAANQT